MKIPTYDSPQVQIQRAPNQQIDFQRINMPEDPTAHGTAALAQGFNDLAGVANQISQQESEKEDLAQVLKAKESLGNLKNQYESDAQQWGLDVDKEWLDTAKKEFNSDVEKIRGTMKTERQVMAFDKMAVEDRVVIDKHLSTVFNHKQQQQLDVNFEANLQTALQTAQQYALTANSPNSQEYDRAHSDAFDVIVSYGKATGKGEQWVHAKYNEWLSNSFTSTVQKFLASGDTKGAREFYNTEIEGGKPGETVASNILDPTGHILAQIKTSDDFKKGIDAGITAFNELKAGGKESDIVLKLASQFGDNEKALRAAESQFKTMAADYRQEQQQAIKQASAPVWAKINDYEKSGKIMSPSRFVSSPEYINLMQQDAHTAQQILEHQTQKIQHQEDRARARQAEASAQQMQNLVLLLANPDSMRNVDLNNLAAQGVITQKMALQLAPKQAEVINVTSAPYDPLAKEHRLYDTTLQSFKIDPKKAPDKYAAAYTELFERGNEFKKSTGKDPDETQMNQYLTNFLTMKVKGTGFFKDSTLSDVKPEDIPVPNDILDRGREYAKSQGHPFNEKEFKQQYGVRYLNSQKQGIFNATVTKTGRRK